MPTRFDRYEIVEKSSGAEIFAHESHTSLKIAKQKAIEILKSRLAIHNGRGDYSVEVYGQVWVITPHPLADKGFPPDCGWRRSELVFSL